MDQDRTYDRIAENHFQALLRSGRDALEAARDIEDAAAFLAAEGQWELAQALRQICLKRRAAEAFVEASGQRPQNAPSHRS